LGAAEVFSAFGFDRKSMLGMFFEPRAKRWQSAAEEGLESARAARNETNFRAMNSLQPVIQEQGLTQPCAGCAPELGAIRFPDESLAQR
jgi:hypothetical protein